MGAFEYRDKWCIMSIQIQYEVMKSVIDFIHSEEWSIDTVDLELCALQISRSFPHEVVERCLETYFVTLDNHKGQLHVKKYVILCATYLLESRESIKLKTFLKQWEKILNDDFQYNIELLKGLVLIKDILGTKYIKWFPAHDLPSEPDKRFKILFQQQPVWEYDDITAYLQDILESRDQVDQLLSKWTLETQTNGKRTYLLRET